MLDLFADLDPPPPADPIVAITAVVAPIARAIAPAPPAVVPSDAAWRYIHPPQVPTGLIARACMCGRQDERAGPDLDHIRCDQCGQPDGLRARPWRPTAVDLARGAMR